MEDNINNQFKEKSSAKKELLKWGLQARNDSNWLRAESSKYGLDASKMVLGHVLKTILGDDANSFAYMHTFIIDSDSIKGNQLNAIERLSWEIETPETPDSLREKLIKIKENLLICDWTNKDSFFVSKKIWEKMRDEVEDFSKKDERTKDVINYYIENYKKVFSARKNQSEKLTRGN